MRKIHMKQFCLLAMLFLCIALKPVSAEGADPDKLWIRAQLTYEFDDGLTGIDDSMVQLHDATEWKKIDGWFYYNKPVVSGQKLRFMDGVRIPEDWDNTAAGKSFKVIVTVQLSEVPAGEAGWDENQALAYESTFDLWAQNYEKTHRTSKIFRGDIKVTLKEYQLDKNGNEVDYVYDKIVVPGQVVSKIVEFTVTGTPTRTEEPPVEEPEKPTPETPKKETPKTETPKSETPKTETPKTETPKTTTNTPEREVATIPPIIETIKAIPAAIQQQVQKLVSRQTGDSSNLPLYVGLTCALLGVVRLVWWKRKKDKDR